MMLVFIRRVSNIVGAARSNAAKVLVVEPPNIILNPESQSLIAGESFELLWRPMVRLDFHISGSVMENQLKD